MILQRLSEFAERIPDKLPSMYGPLQFKWQIELNEDGTYAGITPLSDGSKKNKGLVLASPNVKRTSAVKPLLLADNAKYVLGTGADNPVGCNHFRAFKSLVEQCAIETDEPAVQAIARFLAAHESSPIKFDVQIEPGDNIVFRVDGVTRPIDLKSVRQFWLEQNPPKNSEHMQCLVCGKSGPVDRVSPIPIKGIPGGQSTGMAVVSANQNAFLSYGAEQALIAPTCRSCGEAYANAINFTIRSDEHHVTIGPTVFVFWTAEDIGFNVVPFLNQPQTEDVKSLILSYRTGREGHGVNATAFYALSLSASVARVVVRDWLETTVTAVQACLVRWFGLQRIVDMDGSIDRPYGVYALAASLYLKPNDQMVAEVPRAMERCALTGSPLPNSLLAQAVARNRAEQSITRVRVALIKAVLLSQNENHEEDYMEKLDISCASPGYLCGRLFAELEAAQKAAVNPKATITDRYYGSASASPAIVFGALLRNLQAHMAKLRKERPGVFTAIDTRIQDITSDLGEFPKTLSLKEQALFALGYYHQKAENREAMLAYIERKQQNTQEEAENDN